MRHKFAVYWTFFCVELRVRRLDMGSIANNIYCCKYLQSEQEHERFILYHWNITCSYWPSVLLDKCSVNVRRCRNPSVKTMLACCPMGNISHRWMQECFWQTLLSQVERTLSRTFSMMCCIHSEHERSWRSKTPYYLWFLPVFFFLLKRPTFIPLFTQAHQVGSSLSLSCTQYSLWGLRFIRSPSSFCAEGISDVFFWFCTCVIFLWHFQ